jgi:small-conductance mechanosensitive channel
MVLALVPGPDSGAAVQGLVAMAGLVYATGLFVFAWPVLRSDAWQSSEQADEGTPRLIGGYSWLLGRLLLTVFLACILGAALLGYSRLAIHAGDALLDSLLVVFLAMTVHALVYDLVDAVGAPDTPPGRWLRRAFGLAPDAAIHGRFVVVLLVDVVLLASLAMILPILWGADPDEVADKAATFFAGFSIGQHRISPVDIVVALLVFVAVLGVVRIARAALRDRVMAPMQMQDDIRLSIDAVLNYTGIVVAVLLAITALGIDFTNLALIVGALSVGIGLGLQNLANNTISGVVLLLERPIRVGDRVTVGPHEGIVRRINVRATEIVTGQRATVIVPNSQFLQSAFVNWTHAENVGRLDVPVTAVHGSDPDRIEAALRQAAEENPHVVPVPRPVVMFKAIGALGLEFELRCHIDNPANTIAAQNALHRAVLARLAEAGIAVVSTAPPQPPPPS